MNPAPRSAAAPLLSAFVLHLLSWSSLQADPLDYWHLRRQDSASGSLHGVAYGNGTFVAVGGLLPGVGSPITILSSPDGISWTVRTAQADTLLGITYGGGRFAAVSVNNLIVTSADGVNWERHDSQSRLGLKGIAYGDGVFVAVGFTGTITTSSDGTNWTLRNSNTSQNLVSVTYGNGTFVVVALEGEILTSTNGMTWTKRSPLSLRNLSDVTFGQGRFVAVGVYSGLFTSSDGATWTRAEVLSNAALTSVDFSADTFIALGLDKATSEPEIFTSTDGIQWTPRAAGTIFPLHAATEGNGVFVAVGDGGAILQSDPLTETAPTILVQPQDYTVTTGDRVKFTVSAFPSSPMSYQWLKEGVSIAGTTNAALWLNVVQTSDAGSYSVVVSNRVGAATSRPAKLAVQPTGPLDHWHWRNPVPQGNPLYAVTYGNGLFVTVGEAGTILSSVDAANWIARDAGTPARLAKIAFGNGRFVVLGDGGPLLTSTNGTTWTPLRFDLTRNLQAIAFGNDHFVAVGEAGAVARSSDGIHWTWHDSGTAQTLESVTFAHDTFVAGGRAGTILTSSEGSTWTPRSAQTLDDVKTIAYGNGRFVAAGPVMVSLDGINWNSAGPDDKRFNVIAYGGSRFVGVRSFCFFGGCLATIETSVNGADWTTATEQFGESINDLAYGNGQFVAVGYRGTILTSWDGLNWTPPASPQFPGGLSAVTQGNGTFVAVGGSTRPTKGPGQDSSTIWVSDEGIRWTSVPSPTTAQLNAVTYAMGQFVAVGVAGTILTSTDGRMWTPRDAGIVGATLLDVTWGNGMYVATDAAGTLLTSPDGRTWTNRLLEPVTGLNRITYGNGLFVATGTDGRFVISANGVDWTPTNSGTENYPTEIAFGNGAFVAASLDFNTEQTTLLISADAAQWKAATLPYLLFGLTYANGDFAASRADGAFLTSSDGINWQPHRPAANGAFSGITFGNGAFVGVSGNMILQSDPVADTAPVIVWQSASQSVMAGSAVNVSVTAFGSSSLRYQWLKDGQEIPGANDPILTLQDVQLDAAGLYAVIVRNAFGEARSQAAVLAVDATLEDWHWRNPTPQGNALLSVTYGNGLFVAVGALGTILTSPDNANWTICKSGTRENLEGIIGRDGLFVAVGENGLILTSTDGVTWAQQSSGVTNHLSGVAHGAGKFVAVGGYFDAAASHYIATVLSSTDGVNWTSRATGIEAELRAVIYAKDLFVATALGGVVTSTDGIHWSKRATEVIADSLAYGEGLFVAGGRAGQVWTSPDAITWKETFVSGSFNSIAFSGGLFVGVGDDIYSSPDGVSWTHHNVGVSGFFRGITHAEGAFLAVGLDGAMATSPDGFHWTARNADLGRDLSGIAYGSGIFVALQCCYLEDAFNSRASSRILTSRYGVNWTNPPATVDGQLTGLAYGDGIFAAVSAEGLIYTSENGVVWTNRNSGVAAGLYGITYGNGAFVAVGSEGVILSSADGRIWTLRRSGVANQTLFAVSFGLGLFVAVGSPETILTSPDGLQWVTRVAKPIGTLESVAFGSSTFVAVGGNTDEAGAQILIRTSTDGVNWTARGAGTTGLLHGVASGRNGFAAVGDGPQGLGLLLTSADGSDWVLHRAFVVDRPLNEITCGNGTFVAVGRRGAILQSEPSPSTPPAILEQPQSQNALAGATVSFSVAAFGSTPLSYQWFRNGVALDHATNATLTITRVEGADAGAYLVFVSNAAGAVLSQFAMLVFAPPQLSLRFSSFAELTLLGITGRSYRIEYLPALPPAAAWQPLATISLPTSPFTWLDLQSGGAAQRFYRAVLLP